MFFIDILNLYQIRIMYNAVKNSISYLTFWKFIVPAHRCKLRTEDRGCLVMAGMDNLQ